MPIKIALPKGRLLSETSSLLQQGDWQLDGYHQTTRFYQPKSQRFSDLSAKVFQEKDIPVQVAIGNYDLGICGLDWIEELLAKYPSSGLTKIRNLAYGDGILYMAASQSEGKLTIDELRARTKPVRIVSEYPNLAESFALKNRLRQFNIFPVWGGAEVYPPESADLALVARKSGELLNHDLVPVSSVLNFSAFLIANKHSWETKDLSKIVASIENIGIPWSSRKTPKEKSSSVPAFEMPSRYTSDEDVVRLALPDGHQQEPTVDLLSRAGFQIDDYPSTSGNRRPNTRQAGFSIKMIRPQDMPLQVANGNFDLAITGRDWLREHLYQFPSSPATELLDLKFGKVRIVGVVINDLPVKDIYSLRQLSAERQTPLRVASEYINIADKYARDNHLGMYRIIPTWGASEAFLPEDADLLIENTQTGKTIAKHNLKIIDTLFESTACLIGHKDSVSNPHKRERIKSITGILKTAVEDNPV